LNVWDCDTQLDGLVKREKYEIDEESNKVEELFSGKNNELDDLNEKTNDVEKQLMETNIGADEQDSEKRFYINYRKKSK
jgi:hypothetical protein